MTFDRRTFLRSGIALGLGSWAWGWSGRTMGPSLASNTNQKWALLLAAGQGNGTAGDRQGLMGCSTDKQLLGEVLRGRYGFDASKVASLDPQAMTLSALETLFDNHLRQPVQKGDAVVVAFSGYGSYNPPAAMTPNPTWDQALPYLGLFLSGGKENHLLPLTTLVNWLQSLKTKQVYLVLDCGFSTGMEEFAGNLRSRSGGRGGQMPPGVNVSNSPAKVSLGNITLISATSPGQTAVEVQLGKQSAGLFTLALTQSLWENDSASAMANLWDHSRNLLVPRLGTEQIPQWRSPNNSPDFLTPITPTMGGEGMVTGLVSGNSLQSQIVAVAPLVQKRALVHSCYLTVPAMGTGSDLNPTDNPDRPDNTLWQVQSVKGQSATLTAIATTASTKAESAPTSTAAKAEDPQKETLVGSGLREMYRAVPKTLALTVALAHDLERIERVDATSAFGAIASVEAVINAGEGSADCVFGKLEAHRYSLFTEGGNPLQPLTKSESSGAVKTVISALDPCLNRLLALKWLTLLANGDSTQLGAAFRLVQQTNGDNPLPRLIYQWRSARYPHSPQDNSTGNTGNGTNGIPNAPPSFLPTVATNQALQCQLENLSEEPLYGCLIGVNNRGLSVAAILHPDLKLLQRKEQLTWPSPDDPLWIIGGDKAIAHWFLILSRFPLPGTATALGQQITGNNSTNPPSLENNPPRVLALKNLLPVVLALVQDLTAHGVMVAPVPDDMVLLSTADWLSLPIMYQVV